ncbi:MAG: Asp23/Gls24 family envelope stress response protein [Candidatus Omnitrophica bacterium]|nr:Asp23/Gls24 family envelope stress response protein [Candidatus Omnitrophota bacterium]
MNRRLSSEFGQIKIHRRVISQAAVIAAKGVPGVKGVGIECYGLFGQILKLFRVTGIRIAPGTTKDKELKVCLPIVMTSGRNAVEIAYEVQRRVIAALLDTLNIDSLNVDVKIKKIVEGG